MLYPVTKDFIDLEDNKRLNEVDNWYPRKGLEPSEERIQLLQEKGYIGEGASDSHAPDNPDEEEVEYPLHKGGGNYVLSNGDKVKGKEDAIKAEEALKEGE